MGLYTERRVSTGDGLSLYVREYPPQSNEAPSLLPVVCLPGLTRNSRDFHGLAVLIANNRKKPRKVFTLNSRGRGRSDWDDDKSHYNLVIETSDVVAMCQQLDIPEAIFIGTSRGGLVLHLLIGMKPELIAGSVLNDVGPEVGLEGLRHIQSYLSSGIAPTSQAAAVARLQSIHGHDFPALGPTDWDEMADAIYLEKDGVFIGDYDPAISEALKTLDLSKPGPTLWPQFEALATKPLLVIRGENSLLLTKETLDEMQFRAPGIKTCLSPGQGHAPILHHASVYPAIKSFLDDQG